MKTNPAIPIRENPRSYIYLEIKVKQAGVPGWLSRVITLPTLDLSSGHHLRVKGWALCSMGSMLLFLSLWPPPTHTLSFSKVNESFKKKVKQGYWKTVFFKLEW